MIYFGRDYDASAFYYQRTLDRLTPEQQELASQKITQLKVLDLQDQLASYSENTFANGSIFRRTASPLKSGNSSDPGHLSYPSQSKNCRRAKVQTSRLEDNSSDDLAQAEKASSLDILWPLRTRLLPPSRQLKSQPPGWVVAPQPVNPMKPLQDPWSAMEGKLIRRSRWSQRELDTQQAWDAAFNQMLKSTVLLESDEGEPLIFRLTHTKRLGDGQILIVANGLPLLNASLAHPSYTEIGNLLVGMSACETKSPCCRTITREYRFSKGRKPICVEQRWKCC